MVTKFRKSILSAQASNLRRRASLQDSPGAAGVVVVVSGVGVVCTTDVVGEVSATGVVVGV